jgi:hypothetical protein
MGTIALTALGQLIQAVRDLDMDQVRADLARQLGEQIEDYITS